MAGPRMGTDAESWLQWLDFAPCREAAGLAAAKGVRDRRVGHRPSQPISGGQSKPASHSFLRENVGAGC